MSDYEVHVGDEGTIIKVPLTENGEPLDLTEATIKELKFERKDRSTFKVDAEVWGLATGGILYCLSDDAFFTVQGQMTVQSYIEFVSGKWHTSKETFNVATN